MGVGVGGPAPRPPTCGPALTHGRADAVALGVDEAPDLGEVAVPLGDVLDGGGLHEQRVVRRQGPLDALLVVLHQRRRLAAHEGPHLLEGGDLGFLGHKGRGDGHAVTEHTRGRALCALQTGSGRVLLFTVPGVRTRCSLLRAAHRGPGRAGPKTHGWRVIKPRFRLRPNRLETLGSLRWHKWFSH